MRHSAYDLKMYSESLVWLRMGILRCSPVWFGPYWLDGAHSLAELLTWCSLILSTVNDRCALLFLPVLLCMLICSLIKHRIRYGFVLHLYLLVHYCTIHLEGTRLRELQGVLLPQGIYDTWLESASTSDRWMCSTGVYNQCHLEQLNVVWFILIPYFLV